MKLLPLLCLLSPWFGPGSAQKSSAVVTVAEGEDALLSCSLGSKIEKFDWIKDKDMPDKRKDVFLVTDSSHDSNSQDPQFQGRVLFFKDELEAGNASIKIKRTSLEDNGNYTCVLFEPDRQEFHIRLNVDGNLKDRSDIPGAAPKPHINIGRDRVTWKLLECNVRGVPKPKLEWQSSDGKVLPAYEIKEQNQDGYFYVELHVNVSKTDKYTCVVTQWEIFHKINNTFEVSIPDIVSVVAGHDAVLHCSVDYKENIKSMVFDWKKDDKEVFFSDRSVVDKQFIERLSYFKAELKSGNASIKIHKTQLADSGLYTCHFLNSQKSLVILKVVSQAGWRDSHTGWIVGGVVFVYLMY